MNWIKDKLRWAKENIWLPLSATIVLLLSILFLRKPSRQLLSTLTENRELQEQEGNVINKTNEKVQKDTEVVVKQTKESINKVKAERKKKMMKINNNKKVLLDELSKYTNDELAEMLKKDDEV